MLVKSLARYAHLFLNLMRGLVGEKSVQHFFLAGRQRVAQGGGLFYSHLCYHTTQTPDTNESLVPCERSVYHVH